MRVNTPHGLTSDSSSAPPHCPDERLGVPAGCDQRVSLCSYHVASRLFRLLCIRGLCRPVPLRSPPVRFNLSALNSKPFILPMPTESNGDSFGSLSVRRPSPPVGSGAFGWTTRLASGTLFLCTYNASRWLKVSQEPSQPVAHGRDHANVRPLHRGNGDVVTTGARLGFES